MVLVEQLQSDFRSAAINEKDRAMLEYAVKLTREPWSMAKDDVEKLQRHEFPDAEILDINQITAYFAFVNRLAEGLGVELESFRQSAPAD